MAVSHVMEGNQHVVLMTTKRESETCIFLARLAPSQIEFPRIKYCNEGVAIYLGNQHERHCENPHIVMDFVFNVRTTMSAETFKEKCKFKFRMDPREDRSIFSSHMRVVFSFLENILDLSQYPNRKADYNALIKRSLQLLTRTEHQCIHHLEIIFGEQSPTAVIQSNGTNYRQILMSILSTELAPLLRLVVQKNLEFGTEPLGLEQRRSFQERVKRISSSRSRCKTIEYAGMELFDIAVLCILSRKTLPQTYTHTQSQTQTESDIQFIRHHINNIELVWKLLTQNSIGRMYKGEFDALRDLLQKGSEAIQSKIGLSVPEKGKPLPKEWDVKNVHVIFGHSLVFSSTAVKSSDDLKCSFKEGMSKIDVLDYEKYKIEGKTVLQTTEHGGLFVAKNTLSKDITEWCRDGLGVLGIIFIIDASSDIDSEIASLKNSSLCFLLDQVAKARRLNGLDAVVDVLIICLSRKQRTQAQIEGYIDRVKQTIPGLKTFFEEEIKRKDFHLRFRVYFNNMAATVGAGTLDPTVQHHNNRKLTNWMTQTWKGQMDMKSEKPAYLQLEKFVRFIQHENLDRGATHISKEEFRNIFESSIVRSHEAPELETFYHFQQRVGNFIYNTNLPLPLRDKLIFDLKWFIESNTEHNSEPFPLIFKKNTQPDGTDIGLPVDILRLFAEVKVIKPHDHFSKQDQIVRCSHDLSVPVQEIFPIASCSVGRIKVEWDRCFSEKHGTCFAVGKDAIMTAFHNIKKVIYDIEEKGWKIMMKKHRWEAMPRKFARSQRKQIWQYWREFENDQRVQESWEKINITLENHSGVSGPFRASFPIAFFDENHDVALLKVNEIVLDDRIYLSKNDNGLNVKHGHIKGFPRCGRDRRPFLVDAKVEMDSFTKVVWKLNQTRTFISLDVPELSTDESSARVFKDSRKKDKENGEKHVYVQCSRTIKGGASGSPVFVYEKNRHMIYAMLLRGVPTVMYDVNFRPEVLKERVENYKKTCHNLMYEKCIKMMSVYDLLRNSSLGERYISFQLDSMRIDQQETWTVRWNKIT